MDVEARAFLFDTELVQFSSQDEFFFASLNDFTNSLFPSVEVNLGEGDHDFLDFYDGPESLWGDAGVFLFDGFADLADPSLTQQYLDTNFAGAAQPQEVLRLLNAENPSVFEDGIRFTGVDDIDLTEQSDRVLIQNAGDDFHSGTGEIRGLGGNDVFFINNMPDLSLIHI